MQSQVKSRYSNNKSNKYLLFSSVRNSTIKRCV